VRHVDALAFKESLKRAKVPCELLEMKDAPHRIAEWQKFSPDYPVQIVAWLKAVLQSVSQ
jgi:hypothetical protein